MLALTSLSLVGLLASMRGIASLRSCFTFTCATASDCGSEDISVGTAGAVLRLRVCAAASSWKRAIRIIATVKNLVFTTNSLSAKILRELVDAPIRRRVVLERPIVSEAQQK